MVIMCGNNKADYKKHRTLLTRAARVCQLAAGYWCWLLVLVIDVGCWCWLLVLIIGVGCWCCWIDVVGCWCCWIGVIGYCVGVGDD